MTMATARQQGYILLYTVLAGALFTSLSAAVLLSTLRELDISEQELEAIQARYAADAGVECITYWQTNFWPRPLDETNGGSEDERTVYCNTLWSLTSGADLKFTSPGQNGDPECNSYNGSFQMGPFVSDDDQCADIDIEVEPIAAFPIICVTKLTVNGYNNCSSRDVQRTLWGQM